MTSITMTPAIDTAPPNLEASGMRASLSRTWAEMGRGGQAFIVAAALFAVTMLALATAMPAYASCSGNSVAAATPADLMVMQGAA